LLQSGGIWEKRLALPPIISYTRFCAPVGKLVKHELALKGSWTCLTCHRPHKAAGQPGKSFGGPSNLHATTPYELGQATSSTYGWTAIYPIYVRGEAYLAEHQAREAAIEFQKIIDCRGIVQNEPIGALAHLQIGARRRGGHPRVSGRSQCKNACSKDPDARAGAIPSPDPIRINTAACRSTI
jgi:hypothetical protein